MKIFSTFVYLLLPVGLFAANIAIDKERIYNLSGVGNAYLLFDEQQAATPQTTYTNGWVNQTLYYPLEAIIDLGQDYSLTEIRYFDSNNSDSLRIDCGNGQQWTAIVNQTTASWQSWVTKTTNCQGRYVKVRIKSPSTEINELILVGTALGTNKETTPSTTPHSNATMGELMGMNAFIDDDRAAMQAVGNIREYHSWKWDDGNSDASVAKYPNNKFGFSPSWVSGSGWGWDFDEYYSDLKTRGLTLAPVFQGNPDWLHGFASGDSLKPISIGADSTDPLQYKAHADYMFQFASRYGSTKVPLNQLRVNSNNTAKSGLGTIQYMEGWNEPDKTWKGKTGYFSPNVLAALMSADYDGHQKTMGITFGVKNADANMKYVMPALISLNLDYVKSIAFWSKINRSGSFPADVINFHHYCTDGGGQSGSEATTGISPEQDDLNGRLKTIREYRDRYLPGKELWLSEFGWDTHPDSKFSAQAIGVHDEYEIQGRWLVRAYLEIAAAGFDKAQMFMLRDVWDNSPGTFSTSGLLHDKFDTLQPKYQKKISWFYTNTLHKQLKNYRFESQEPHNSLRIYKFQNTQSADSVAYVIWNPDDAASDVNLTLAWPSTSARIITLNPTIPLGIETTQIITNKQLSLTINGRPTLTFATQPTSRNLQFNNKSKIKPIRIHYNLMGQVTP